MGMLSAIMHVYTKKVRLGLRELLKRSRAGKSNANLLNFHIILSFSIRVISAVLENQEIIIFKEVSTSSKISSDHQWVSS